MSKLGPCRTCPELAVAWIRLIDGTHLQLCKPCLDAWFDMADEQPQLEPRIWGWLVRRARVVAVWDRGGRAHRLALA